MSDVAVTEKTLEPGLVSPEQHDRLGADLDLLLLPDFVDDAAEGRIASFAEATQELRVNLAENGVRVELAVPEGATPRPYEQHVAMLLLPIVLAVPSTIASLWQMARWIDDWANQRPQAEIRYREARYDASTGNVVVRELSGRGEKVVEAIRAQLEAGNTDGEGES